MSKRKTKAPKPSPKRERFEDEPTAEEIEALCASGDAWRANEAKRYREIGNDSTAHALGWAENGGVKLDMTSPGGHMIAGFLRVIVGAIASYGFAEGFRSGFHGGKLVKEDDLIQHFAPVKTPKRRKPKRRQSAAKPS